MSRSYNRLPPELAKRWEEYVDCKARMRRLGPFLLNVLDAPTRHPILDLSMGVGCEAVFLASQGYSVVGSERDVYLCEQALRRARLADVSIQHTLTDWPSLWPLLENQSFASVLLLGNSLCHLPDGLAREELCRQANRVLVLGGRFVVDRRNFDYIVDNKSEVLSGRFRYSANVMYCERGIVGRPTAIEPDRIQLSCFEKTSGRALGHFDIHAFRGTELTDLVSRCGFSPIATYRDFASADGSHWDFETLVCTKAKEGSG